jgi:tetratricopeptide (TPR) repeat protein
MKKKFALILLLLLAVLCTLASGQTINSLIIRSGDSTDPWKPCWTHGAWGNPIGDPEAEWVWATYNASNPERGETQTYIREFNIDGDPTYGKLTITADNGYTATLNGQELGSGHDWGAANTYDISSKLIQGGNTLKIIAVNDPVPQSNPQTNPAGLLYKLEASGKGSELAGAGVPPELGVNPSDYIKEYDQDSYAPPAEPTTVEGWNAKGLAFYNQGKYDEAIQAYGQALTLDQNDGATWYNRAVAYEAKGDIENAIQCVDQAIYKCGYPDTGLRAKLIAKARG